MNAFLGISIVVSFVFRTTEASLKCYKTEEVVSISAVGTPKVESNIGVSDSAVILDLNVKVNIQHSYLSDLVLSLESTTGKRKKLMERRGAWHENLINTVFDQDGTNKISDSSYPFDNQAYQPVDNLDDYNGENTEEDMANIDGGSLENWEICFEVQPVQVGLFQSAKDKFISKHTSCRSNVHPAPQDGYRTELVWDNNLEAFIDNHIKKYVKTCYPFPSSLHDRLNIAGFVGTEVGENLWEAHLDDVTEESNQISMTDYVTDKWCAQGRMYNFADNTCEVAKCNLGCDSYERCHAYTQMVNVKQTKIGCSMVKCDSGAFIAGCVYNKKLERDCRPYETNTIKNPSDKNC